jgi:hypothetical protein
MKKKITTKQNWEQILKYKMRFLEQKTFPSLPRPYEKRIQPILHTGRLIFIRNKFLFLGLLRSFEEKDMYLLFSLLKSYWENVAAFGYYYIRISNLLATDNEEKAFELSGKIGLGGRKFPTAEMASKSGHSIEDFTLPNIITMMDVVDKDLQKRSKMDGSVLRTVYDEVIAEGGHTTYTGLIIASKWSPDKKSQLPDLDKKWQKEDKSYLINLFAMSTLIFFVYWDKFEEIK